MDEQKCNADRMLPIHVAVQIALLIVGPIPVFILALLPAAALEGVIELATWDSSYYQQHRWCPFAGCLLSGSIIFLARRIPFLGHGIWIGPLLYILGTAILLR